MEAQPAPESASDLAGLRVLIAGGGTGGHLFPGIAVAEEVRARGGVVRFVGTQRGLEARVLPEQGWPVDFIEVRGLKGRKLRGVLAGVLRLPRAYWQSRRILRAFAPDVVIGVGGYASGPIVMTARTHGIATLVLEQNSIPGLTNRVLGRFVDRVACMFPDVAGRFPPRKVVVLGNPVRRAIVARLQATQAQAAIEQRSRLLVFGGSQGARALNEVVFEAAPELRSRLPELEIWHQTGPADHAQFEGRYRDAGLQGFVRCDAFIEDMATAYAWCDLVVCRAGATSLAELAIAGKPAVLVPFPFATDDHQRFNARSLVDVGAAVLIDQGRLTPSALVDAVVGLLGDPPRRAAMGRAMLTAGKPDAAKAIVDLSVSLAALRGRPKLVGV